MVSDVLNNRVLVVPSAIWILAQCLKVVLHLFTERRLDLRYLTTAGGMPSSHSALVTSLATAIAKVEGVGSPFFALAAVFAAVVMYDAAGVRRAVSVQARILNRMLDELFQRQSISEERLKELIGHTPFEVLVGATMGIALTLWWM
ncbi:MAG: divergent PAP2 family protein [Chloroflexi bacterium]|nr:divergent PAP2 family protein [Chloroflexota bacterium]